MKVKENRKSLSEEESARLGNLIWKHRNLICKVIANRLNKHTYYLLEDCEAEVLALASEAGADLLYHPNPAGWFVLTAKNVVYNVLRKERKACDMTSSKPIEEVSDSEDLLEDIVYENWIQQGVIEELLSRLSPREQAVYELLFVRGFSIREAAKELHIQESTLRSTKQNLIDKIKRDIKTYNFKGL